MSPERRLIVIAAVCALLIIVVFALGVGFGGREDGGGASWQARLTDRTSAAPLQPRDFVRVGGTCGLEESSITVTGSCELDLAETGSRFDLGPPTRQAQLVPSGPIRLEVVVEGTTISRTASDEVELTYGRNGGSLILTCGFSPCKVAFEHP